MLATLEAVDFKLGEWNNLMYRTTSFAMTLEWQLYAGISLYNTALSTAKKNAQATENPARATVSF